MKLPRNLKTRPGHEVNRRLKALGTHAAADPQGPDAEEHADAAGAARLTRGVTVRQRSADRVARRTGWRATTTGAAALSCSPRPSRSQISAGIEQQQEQRPQRRPGQPERPAVEARPPAARGAIWPAEPAGQPGEHQHLERRRSRASRPGPGRGRTTITAQATESIRKATIRRTEPGHGPGPDRGRPSRCPAYSCSPGPPPPRRRGPRARTRRPYARPPGQRNVAAGRRPPERVTPAKQRVTAGKPPGPSVLADGTGAGPEEDGCSATPTRS